jgi:hypothetical protein
MTRPTDTRPRAEPITRDGVPGTGALAPTRDTEPADGVVAPIARDELVTEEGLPADEDLFGVALSGGGIRSATFNLGLLQGLQKTGLLRELDYLSTVSGGGYIGGFWTAWRHNSGARADLREPMARPPSGDVFPGRPDRGVEDPAVRHLRRFSNFLSPRLGLLSYDTGRLAVAGLTAAIPTVLATLSLLVLAVLGWSLVAATLFNGGPWAYRTFFMLTLATFVIFEVLWVDREGGGMDRTYNYLAAGILVLTAIGLGAFTSRLAPVDAAGAALLLPTLDATAGVSRVYYVLPALLWGAAFFGLALVRAVVSRYATSFERVSARSALDRVLSRLLFLVAAWLVVTGLWLGAAWLYGRVATGGGPVALYSGVTAALAAAFAWSRKLGATEPNKPFGSAIAARLKPWIPQLLAYAVVVLVVGAVMMGLIHLAAGAVDMAWAVRPATVAAAITIATLLFFHPNRIGLHSFYRGRLARAYLGASNPESAKRARPFTEESKGDDIPLHELAVPSGARVDEARGGRDTDAARAGVRPVHLICCAVNDLLPPEPLTNMQRGAASAVLSPLGLSVADTGGTGERPAGVYWSRWTESSPTLGAAITASGAAFNSMMGTFSKRLGPATTFVLAMLNLRLGMWLQHPRYFEGAPPRGSVRQRIRQADRRLGPRSSREWWLPGLRFYKELFGMSSAQGRDVHLSDGGHFENTAVYELIRRQCRYIIAADCGADPDRAFDDVANLIRRVRQDFGVDIRIDLSPLRLNETEHALQPMVAGDIHYPSGDPGVLLLFKPTLVGDEPPDVTQYRTRNAAFPNESTGDQFYDEAQWEAYRQLGEHAADTAFAFMRRTGVAAQQLQARDLVARAFALARFEWLPKPPRFEERIARFADRAADIDVDIMRRLTRADGSGPADAGPMLRTEPAGAAEAGTPGEPGSAGRRYQDRHGGLAAVSTPPTDEAGASPTGPRSQADRPAGHEPRAAESAVHAEQRAQATGQAPPAPGWTGQAAVQSQHAGADGAMLKASLDAARRTVLFMEETYYAWDLETSHRQPLSLGIMNCMGRWSQAPQIRMWWPLLKPLHSPPFTRFVENSFGLVGIRRADGSGAGAMDGTGGVTSTSEPDATGLATHCWLLGAPPDRAPADARHETTFIAYRLDLMYERERAWSVQAAMLRAFRSSGDAVLYWDADDFFVPVGLWGVGIGEDFLRRLRELQHVDGVDQWVCLRRPAAGDVGAARGAADRRRMYKAAGFRDAASAPTWSDAALDVDWLVRRRELPA